MKVEGNNIHDHAFTQPYYYIIPATGTIGDSLTMGIGPNGLAHARRIALENASHSGEPWEVWIAHGYSSHDPHCLIEELIDTVQPAGVAP